MAMEDYRINKENGLEFGLYSLGDHMPNAPYRQTCFS